MILRSLFESSLIAPLHEYYHVAGAVCSLSTNSEFILGAARGSFTPMAESRVAADASMRLWVDPSARSGPPWPSAHFRGLNHLVFAAFDAENTVLVDLRKRRAVGRLSPAMSADRHYLRRVIFPTLFGIFTETIAVTPLHCACVERGGRGLLLTGASGSGKSTLSLALARNCFRFLSDEWTYFSWREGRLRAWGLSTPLKLLPDAYAHFPELATMQPTFTMNGELAYEIEPEEIFGVRRSRCAEPDCLILLERQDTPGFALSRLSPVEVAAEFEEDVDFFEAHRLLEGRDLLVRTVRGLGQISCWRLRYGGQPAQVARALVEFLESKDGNGPSGEASQALRAQTDAT